MSFCCAARPRGRAAQQKDMAATGQGRARASIFAARPWARRDRRRRREIDARARPWQRGRGDWRRGRLRAGRCRRRCAAPARAQPVLIDRIPTSPRPDNSFLQKYFLTPTPPLVHTEQSNDGQSGRAKRGRRTAAPEPPRTGAARTAEAQGFTCREAPLGAALGDSDRPGAPGRRPRAASFGILECCPEPPPHRPAQILVSPQTLEIAQNAEIKIFMDFQSSRRGFPVTSPHLSFCEADCAPCVRQGLIPRKSPCPLPPPAPRPRRRRAVKSGDCESNRRRPRGRSSAALRPFPAIASDRLG